MKDGSIVRCGTLLDPGFVAFCLNSDYVDIMLKQLSEIIIRYSCSGLWLDGGWSTPCYCQKCISDMSGRGIDPRDDIAARAFAEERYMDYTRRIHEVINRINPSLEVFINTGHTRKDNRQAMSVSSHIDIESLPTASWGYDHFRIAARYVPQLGLESTLMTARFNFGWGEFGGYKHRNALIYETSCALAFGAKCCIGDQMHPLGELDALTYDLIGAAYSEVEKKELWCDDATPVTDIGVLSQEAVQGEAIQSFVDSGTVRILQECHYLFDFVDTKSDFTKHKVIVLPDEILVDDTLLARLKAYTQGGGKVLITGNSAIRGAMLQFDVGANYMGEGQYLPCYFRPDFTINEFLPASFVLYHHANEIKLASGGTSLGAIQNSYFNRDLLHFCSHLHAPSTLTDAYPGITMGSEGAYIGWKVFLDYYEKASLINKYAVREVLDRLLGDKKALSIGLPAQGITTVMHQKKQHRYIHHLIYASPVRKNEIEVIEDIVAVYGVNVELKLQCVPKRVYLAPKSIDLQYTCEGGVLRYTVPEINCHQMVVVDY